MHEGSRRSDNTRLFVITGKWQKCLEKRVISGTILINFSKALDCILHNLLILKLATSLSESWRPFFFQKTSKQQKLIMLLYGVPQGPFLSSLLFNNYACDIFFWHNQQLYCSRYYADDNVPHNFNCSPSNVTSNLEKSTNSL